MEMMSFFQVYTPFPVSLFIFPPLTHKQKAKKKDCYGD